MSSLEELQQRKTNLEASRDGFYEDYLVPFKVNGTSMEDVDSIYEFYRSAVLEATSLEEVKLLRESLGFLIMACARGVCEVYSDIDKLKRDILSDKSELTQDELNICLPSVMLWGRLIAERYKIPEYVAAFQYMIAMYDKEIIAVTKEIAVMKDDRRE